MRIGIGIGTEFSRFASGTSIDPDAQAFITAAGITDPTQQSAVNTLVVDLKAASLWNKMAAFYPFVGGSASSHKFNLKDPRDLDAAYRLVFSGGWTHNANGVTGNGTNSSARTYLKPSNLDANHHISVYSRIATNTAGWDVVSSGASISTLICGYLATSFYGSVNGSIANKTTPNSTGFFIVNRESSSLVRYYRNSSDLGTLSQAIGTISTADFYIGSTSGTSTFSTNNYAAISIGNNLSGSDYSNLSTLVAAFQTTLGRNV